MNKIAAIDVQGRENTVFPWLSESHHVTPAVLALRENKYLCLFKIQGRSHHCRSEAEVAEWVQQLNSALSGILDEHVECWSYLHHHPSDERLDAEFSNPFCRRYNERYQQNLDQAELMVNDYYFAICYRAVADAVLESLTKAERLTPAQIKAAEDGAIERIEEMAAHVAGVLAPYQPELLTTYRRGKLVYSRVMEWFAYLSNGEWLPVPVTDRPFFEELTHNAPAFSPYGEIGKVIHPTGERYFQIMQVRNFALQVPDFGAASEAGQLNIILEAPFECILTQSFTPLEVHAADRLLKGNSASMAETNDPAKDQAAALEEARMDLAGRRIALGPYHGTVLVFGKSPAEVKESMRQLRLDLLYSGVVPEPARATLEAAFWAQHPGNKRFRPYDLPITSENFFCLSGFHNFPRGKKHGNPWGDAVTMFHTANPMQKGKLTGSPYYFNFHPSNPKADVKGERLPGNTMILGKTGEGKTVTLGHLLLQASKFNARQILFDYDRGLLPLVWAMGGRYSAMRLGQPTGWNPFGLDPTPRNLDFWKDLVVACISTNGAQVSHFDEQQIDQAITALVTTVPQGQRNFTTFAHGLPGLPHATEDDRPSVFARLQRWLRGGEFGWLLDNDADMLDLHVCRTFGFDLTEFLASAAVRDVSAMYLLHRAEELVDGTPFMLVFDEGWTTMELPPLMKMLKEKEKSIRKQLGIIVFSTQEAGDALNSAVAATMASQTSTVIVLHYPAADRAAFKERFHFTDAMFDALMAIKSQSHQMLVAQNGEGAVVTLDLAGMQDELAIISSTPDRSMLVERLMQERGSAPEAWVPEFCRLVREGLR